MKALIVAALVSLFPIIANADTVCPKGQIPLKTFVAISEAGETEVIVHGPDEIEEFKASLANEFQTSPSRFEPFDTHVSVFKPGVNEVMIGLSKDGCMMRVSVIPASIIRNTIKNLKGI